MSFDTVTFWIFFAIAWGVWRLVPFASAKLVTVFLSLLFYGWWNPWFIPLIVLSSAIDYLAGGRIHASSDPVARRRWLLLSLVGNLGLLSLFKYGPFLVENVSDLGRWFGLGEGFALEGWIIPVGISFYTFQSLSYTIDIYRKQLEPARSIRDFLLYVAFFPQLVAGPIVRARDLLPQFASRRRLLPQAVEIGLYQISLGLFLKVVVADNLAPAVDRVFDAEVIRSLSPLSVWLGVVYFSVQILADFAGYSSIAIGLAYVMGLRFPENFRYPYISRGLSEFWTRWHISLSTWLRDYLYISLGGNRCGRRRTYLALMVTMVLGGLWHGPAWTFVAWGLLHGLGLIIERTVRGKRAKLTNGDPLRGVGDAAWRLVQIACVYVFVLTTWVFFRAEDFPMAWQLLGRMYIAPFSEPIGMAQLANARHLVLVLPVFVLHLGQLGHEWLGLRKTAALRAVAAGLFLFFLTIIDRDAPTAFIYFQF